MRLLSCETVRDELPAMLDGRLDSSERRAVAAHLEVCAECRAEADVLAMLRRQTVAVPPGLEERVKEAVRRQAGRARRAPSWALAAAAAAAVLLGGVLLLRHTGGDPLLGDPEAVAIAAGMLQPFADLPESNGLLAGGLQLDDLSTEELQLLLTELD
jgi:anti-sigma factor RsiW